MSRTLMIILAATLVFAPGVVSAETSADATQPGTGAASTTVADTVKQAIASEDLHRAALARLEQAGQWRGLADRVAALEEKFDALTAGAVSHPELINSIEFDRHLRGLHREAETIVENLAGIVRRLEHDGSLLEASARNWQERAQFLESQVVPPAVLERARTIKAKLEHANARIREFRDNMLLQSGPRGGSAGASRRCTGADRRTAGTYRCATDVAGAGPDMAPRRTIGRIRTRRRRVERYLADAAGLPGAGRCGACRIVSLHSGTDRLALHQTPGPGR